MANQKTYTITIEGLSESYEGVKSLVDVLNQLGDKTVKVAGDTDSLTQAESKQSSAVSDSTKSVTDKKEKLDALGKAQKQLSEYDVEYQTELAKTKAEIAANNKEIKDLVKQQEAASIVEAKQLDTYAEKQQYLSALNVLIRNHSQETEADRAAIEAMVQESAELQTELKEFDANMQQFTRNVGNYNEAANIVVESNKSMKAEIKELTMEMAEMLANGVSKTDAAYLALAERAGTLKDAISDASQDIAHFASDTSGMDNVVNLAQSGVAAFQLYQSAMTLFGEENKEASEAMKTLMATMSALQALQTIQNSLLSNGTATGKLYTTMVNGLKSMLGLKRTEVEANNVVDQESIAITDSKAASDQMLTTSEQELALAEQEVVAAKEMNASASMSEMSATMSDTTATQSNTTAKQANTAATNTMSTATKGADASTKALSASNKTAATTTNTLSTAQKAGAVASRTLGTALKAIPLMLIIGLVAELITNWQSIWNWFKKTFPVIGQLDNAFKKWGGVLGTVKGAVMGVGKAIIHWLTNPIKTLADVVGKLLKGDFSGAWKAAVDGLKNQFTGLLDEFNKGMKSQEQSVALANERKASEEKITDLQRKQEILQAKGLQNTKEARNLNKQIYDEKMKQASLETDLDKKAQMRHDAEVEYQQNLTSYRKEDEKASKAAAKAAAKAAKDKQSADKKAHDAKMKQIDAEKKAQEKAAADAKKAAEEYQKMIDDLVKKSQQLSTNSSKKIADNYKYQLQVEEQWYKEAITSMIAVASKAAEEGEASFKQLTDALNIAESFNNIRKNIQLTLFGEDLKTVKEELKDMVFEVAQTREALEFELFKSFDIKDQVQYEEYLKTVEEWKKATDQIKKGELEQQWLQLQKTMQLSARNDAFGVLNKLKEDYEKATDEVKKGELAKAIKEQEDKMFKAVGKNRESLYKQWVELTKQEKELEETAITRIGKWYYRDIEVPVSFSFEGMKTKYLKAIDEISKEIYNKNKDINLADMFLDLGVDTRNLSEEVRGAMDMVEQGYEEGADTIINEIKKVIQANTSLSKVFDTMLGGAEDILLKINDNFRKMPNSLEEVLIVLKTVGATEKQINEITEKWGSTASGVSAKIVEKLGEIIRGSKFYVDYTSTEGRKAYEFFKKLNDDYLKEMYTAVNKSIDDSIKAAEKGLKNLEQQFKDHPLRPEMREDMFSSSIAGDVIDRGKTVENYKAALKAAEDYYDAVRYGGEQRQQIEDEWQKRVDLTGKTYGYNSKEYQKAVEQQIEAIDKLDKEESQAYENMVDARKKLRDADDEYFDNLSKRMKKVFDVFKENVLDPIGDTFSALFTMELEEMNEYLDKLSEMLEDATSLREESASRIEEINSELRDSDSQNLDALRQRLADEEVLLAERQAMERKLQLEKEDQEKRIQAKEKQQKKAELLQSMFEGIANTAVGVTAALKYGPILGPIFAAIVGAMGAAQVAIIGQQINKLKDGGLLEGASHSQGGMRIQGTNIEVEGGEFVVNKKSTRKYLPLLEKINNEGRTNNRSFKPMGKFAQGGRLNVERASRAAEYGMSNMAFERALSRINMRPVVSVVDINEGQEALTKVEVLAGREVG